jgi:hypothetical protein
MDYITKKLLKIYGEIYSFFSLPSLVWTIDFGRPLGLVAVTDGH